jgi:glycosyltransferase involved in cell wall biosynthesis
MTAQQRVLVITSTYPRHEADYAVPWMREIHKQMAERGHQITVLAPSYKGLRSHTLDGIEVCRFRYAPASIERLTHEEGASYKIRKAYMQLLAIPYIIFGCIAAAWLASTRKFDVVHVHWPFPHGLMGQVARFFSGAPLVIMSHGAEFSLARRKKWVSPFLKQSLRAADLLISNSSDTARMVTKLSNRKCHVLPYGTTVCAANAEQPNNEIPRVLFTGRLIERKGLEYLLQAVPKILAKHPAQFIITGDGDQRQKLEKLHQELGLGDSVKFLGFVTNEQLGHEYANCDIWVNPAIVDSWGDAEGLGVGAIEAYTYFKPVVAGNVGGIPDAVIDGVTGRLVPEKDSDALADAISELLADPEKRLRMGRNGFYFAKQIFSWNRIVSDLESLYLEVNTTREAAPITPATRPFPAPQIAKKNGTAGKGLTQVA